MSAKMCKRLFWKGMREYRLPILILLALPPLFFPLASLATGAFFGGTVVMISVYVQMMFFMWMIGAGGVKKKTSDIPHLPVKPAVRLVFSLILPCLAAGAVGAWTAYWGYPYVKEAFFIQMTMEQYVGLAFVTYVGGFSLGVFFLEFSNAALAVLAGMFVIFPFVLFAALSKYVRIGMTLPTAAAAAGFAGFLIAAFLPRVGVLRFRRQIAIGAAAAAVLAALVPGAANVSELKTFFAEELGRREFRMTNPDYQARVKCKPGTDEILFEFSNSSSERKVERSFAYPAAPLDIVDGRYVYVARQAEGDENIKVMVWDTEKDSVREIASVPTWKGILAKSMDEGWHVTDYYGRYGSVSPDGDYMVLYLVTLVGPERNTDVWLVDFVGKRNRLVMAEWSFNPEITVWADGKVYLSGDMVWPGAFVVDLKSMKAEMFRIPSGNGG